MKKISKGIVGHPGPFCLHPIVGETQLSLIQVFLTSRANFNDDVRLGIRINANDSFHKRSWLPFLKVIF